MKPVQALSTPDFRRLLGVKPDTFEAMLAGLVSRAAAKKKRGGPPDLGLEEPRLLALQFWREYRTRYHLAMEWQVGENTVCRPIKRVENALLKSGKFDLPARPKAGGSEPAWSVVVVDVSGHPVERPKKSGAPGYAGQQPRHPLKSQVAVDKQSGTILAAACGKGRVHDFRLFKAQPLARASGHRTAR